MIGNSDRAFTRIFRLGLVSLIVASALTTALLALHPGADESEKARANFAAEALLCKHDDPQCLSRLSATLLAHSNVPFTIQTVVDSTHGHPELGDGCHGALHRIGHIIASQNDLTVYPFKDVTPYFSVCGTGLIHGMIEGVNLGDQDPLETFDTICRHIGQTNPDKVNESTSQCWHAVGHNLMLTSDSVSESLRFCERLSGDIAVEQCGAGVFMILKIDSTPWLADDLSTFSKTKSYCSAIPVRFGPSCYAMIGNMVWTNFIEAGPRYSRWCQAIGSDEFRACVRTVSGTVGALIAVGRWAELAASPGELVESSCLQADYPVDIRVVCLTDTGIALVNLGWSIEDTNRVLEPFHTPFSEADWFKIQDALRKAI